MKYLKQFLQKHKGKTILNVLLILIQSIGTLILPFLIAGIIDQGIVKNDMNTIYRIGGCMLIVTLFTCVISIWSSWSAADLGALFGKDMRENLFIKSQNLSLQQFNSVGLSSMVTRATADISTMQSTIGIVIQMALPAPLLVVAAFIMTFRTSQKLAFILLISITILLIFVWWMLKVSKPLSSIIQKKLDRINLLVRESVTGTRVIRAFGNEHHEEKRSGKAFHDYAETMIRLGHMFAIVNPAVWLIIGVCMAAIVWFGGLLTGSNRIEIGQITAVIEYAILALAYLIMAAGIAVTLPKMRSCLDRLEEVLDTTPNIKDASALKQINTKAPIVAFKNVNFSYPGAEEAVLQDLSFSCHPGETTAIIGGTGSGKSTIADLLLRLHDISSGSISLYGADIRKLSQDVLRKSIGCVPQKAFLFSGTIAENLRMGNETATDADLWDALRVAQADTFVSNLPLKLDALVAQGGTNFSGGQRQRLAITRALIRKASVYIFDDSFSALDVKTDAALRHALVSHGTNSAKLIIAQRVSTILNADQILVLDNGCVVGRGRHKDLLKTCGVYQDIVKSQMEQKEA